MTNQNDNTSFFDLIFNIALGFVLLFAVAVIVMKVESQKANIKTKAEFVIILTWQEGINHDVDLWVRDPLLNVTSYKSKHNGVTHLDRDDLGMVNDNYTKDGKTVYILVNQEIATVRGFIAGEWVINTHFFSNSRLTADEQVARCNIIITKLNPTARLILNKSFLLERWWQEETIATLVMSSDGEILSLDEDISIPLVKQHVETAVPNYYGDD